MGTDVYLSWSDMGDGDKEKQITGWSIKAGKIGYLRASIGMVEENGVLRAIFPEHFWSGEKCKYDFKENFEQVKSILKNYVLGNSIDIQDRDSEQVKMGLAVVKMLSEAFDADEVKLYASADIERVEWAESVFEFMQLGLQLQENGKEPEVCISW